MIALAVCTWVSFGMFLFAAAFGSVYDEDHIALLYVPLAIFWWLGPPLLIAQYG